LAKKEQSKKNDEKMKKQKEIKAKEEEKKEKKNDMLKAMQEQESSNMGELVEKAEKTSKNPAYASVVAHTIALMKRQKKSMDGPFSNLFKSLHSEEMIQSKDAEDTVVAPE